MVTFEDLAESEKPIAERSYFPNGTYGYSQIGSSIIKFPKPVQLHYIYLKQHRAPNFYLKKSKIIST